MRSGFGARKSVVAEVLRRYLLLFNVGLEGLLAFYGHEFKEDQVAGLIGWNPSPFQYGVAKADLAIGAVVFSASFKGTFWFAAILATTVWLLGNAAGHVRQIVIAYNYARDNAGAPLDSDLILPTVLMILAFSASISIRPALAFHTKVAAMADRSRCAPLPQH